MNSEKEILHLMNEYCFAIDSGDLATFGRLFAHAQWIAEGKKPGKESANNLIIYADGTPRTKHMMSNVDLEIDELTAQSLKFSFDRVLSGVGVQFLDLAVKLEGGGDLAQEGIEDLREG